MIIYHNFIIMILKLFYIGNKILKLTYFTALMNYLPVSYIHFNIKYVVWFKTILSLFRSRPLLMLDIKRLKNKIP